MLTCIRSSHLATVAMLACGLALHGSDAFAAKSKNVRLKKQEETQTPFVRPVPPTTATPSPTSSSGEAAELYLKGLRLLHEGSVRSALPILQEAEMRGSADAMVALAKIYAQGGDVEKDEAQAERYLKRAVAAELSNAYAALAAFYYQRSKLGDKERAGNLLYEGITKGHTKPFKNASGDTYSLFYFMANFAYLDTNAGSARFSNAFKWANEGAEAGDPASMVLLSQLYDGGNGVEKNPETALMWAQRAAELGSGTGRLWQESLKKKYAAATPEKPSTPSIPALPTDLSALSAEDLYKRAEEADKAKDYANAAKLFLEASKRTQEQYAVYAAGMAGTYYMDGNGVPQDYRLAEKLYRQYADAGNHLGFSDLARLYMQEQPGMVGNKKAREVLLEGIGKGHFELNVDIGDFERDLQHYPAARDWYWKGVAANHGEAMYGLGKLYRDGQGVEKNPKRALYWARRSEKVGEYYGTLLIKDLEKEGVTEEDVPSDAEIAADIRNAKDDVSEALNSVPPPDPVAPPTFTETPPVASPPASPPPSSSWISDLLNRLPPPPPPPEITTVEPDKPAPTSDPAIPASPAELLRTEGEKQRAEAKELLETGLKAYQNGHFTRAFRLFRESARKGNDQAQYEAAEMLIEGQGVEKDRATGKQWLMLAVLQGNADAKQLQARVNAEDAAKPAPAAPPKPSEPVIGKVEPPPVLVKPVEPPPVAETKPVPIPITEKRVALVIGNSAYPAGAALSNPRNDAGDLGSALRKVGFDVVSGTDLTQRGFADAMAQFADKADGADVALIFYAGHAMQLDGENFLLPVDVRADSALNARLTSLSLQTVIGEVETRVKTTLVFLDACRNNPIEEALKAKLRQSKRALAETRGLARVTVNSPDTLVVFATQPNATAADGKGRNSPFTEALLENIAAPGVEIETLMKRVSASVGKKTYQKQEPERLSRLKSEFYFVPVK
jgi:TPR repeat protein